MVSYNQYILFPPHTHTRSKDHRWCPDPVCEEAGRRDDLDRVLSQRVCPHRPAAFYGVTATKVRPQPLALRQLLV